MLKIDDGSRILIHPGVTDMRKGVNGLMLLAKGLRQGEVHVFCSKDRRKVKILEMGESCCYLHQKVIYRSRFQWPMTGSASDIRAEEIMAILDSPDFVTRVELSGKSLNLKAF